MAYEVYLGKWGNWGNVVCESTQEKDYMIAAKDLKDIYQSVQSWVNAWLYPTMEAEYLAALTAAKEKCEKLWELIPYKENLRKMHTGIDNGKKFGIVVNVR